jgi:hypothetical protein
VFIALESFFHCYSIAIGLLGPEKFVDRRKNSVDRPRNEFRIQPLDLVLYFSRKLTDSGAKTRFFAVLAPVGA